MSPEENAEGISADEIEALIQECLEPRSATVAQYHSSTGFEALLGSLYLQEKMIAFMK